MEDNQKLKLLQLAVVSANDLNEAESNISLILGNKLSHASHTDNKDDFTEEDGVYLCEDGHKPVRFKDVIAYWKDGKKCDVMVSYHGHKWIVAKEDLNGEELPLLSDDSHPERTSSFYKGEIEALNDFDMKSCTDHLRKAGIAFELDADLYIPTVGQLAAMCLFHKELNKALEMVDWTPMKEDMY